jgi:hypothetical protein
MKSQKNILPIALLITSFAIGSILANTQISIAQIATDQMITDMRTSHTILEKNVDQLISLIQNNHTAEALNLLDGLKIKVHHMNSMFDDLVWEMSNQGH